jgi:hypothetical protein
VPSIGLDRLTAASHTTTRVGRAPVAGSTS